MLGRPRGVGVSASAAQTLETLGGPGRTLPSETGGEAEKLNKVKIWKIAVIILKFKQCGSNRDMRPKDADGMANSVDLSGAV